MPRCSSSDGAPARSNHSAADSAGTSDDALVVDIIAGEAHAFETLFHRYYSPLCAFAYRCVDRADIAEDLVQEVFLYTWRHREGLDVHESIRAYLYTAIRNAAMSHRRHARVVERRMGEVVALFDRPPATPDRVFALSEADAALHRAIARLPERCRLVFTLQREQGMTYADVARALGISPKTVDVQMGRALKALRRMLGPGWP